MPKYYYILLSLGSTGTYLLVNREEKDVLPVVDLNTHLDFRKAIKDVLYTDLFRECYYWLFEYVDKIINQLPVPGEHEKVIHIPLFYGDDMNPLRSEINMQDHCKFTEDLEIDFFKENEELLVIVRNLLPE